VARVIRISALTSPLKDDDLLVGGLMMFNDIYDGYTMVNHG